MHPHRALIWLNSLPVVLIVLPSLKIICMFPLTWVDRLVVLVPRVVVLISYRSPCLVVATLLATL